MANEEWGALASLFDDAEDDMEIFRPSERQAAPQLALTNGSNSPANASQGAYDRYQSSTVPAIANSGIIASCTDDKIVNTRLEASRPRRIVSFSLT